MYFIIFRVCLFVCFRSVTPYDFPHLDTLVKKIVNDKQPFERLEMKKEDLLQMFQVGNVGSLN
jgi:threonyl-tRNA synthetase